jgi:carboxypeptidase Taq
MRDVYDDLLTRLSEVRDLGAARSVLYWDQTTQMPAKGGADRGRSISALAKICHEKFTDPEIGELLDQLSGWEPARDSGTLEHDVLRVVRRDYDRAVRVPAEYAARASAHSSAAYQAWLKARPENDFAAVVPVLEKGLDLAREFLSFFPDSEHIADPMIDGPDPGMTVPMVRELFTALRAELVPLVDEVCSRPAPESSCLHQPFARDAQMTFSRDVAEAVGYDFDRGRLDLTAHPFMIRFGQNDIRITTRVDDEFLGDCLYSTIHEAGHAMYEQGLAEELGGSPVAGGASMGVHESQSRLWENIVGRSREFWQYWLPKATAHFPEQLGNVSLEDMVVAVNRVERSLIRTESDELTYNLHIMIRFDLELAMLEGDLAVKDLRDAWNARYESDLGLTPDTDSDGVLQDVHWFHGRIGGMFHGYTIGNVMAAQFYEAALNAHPDIPACIASGDYSLLYGFLRDNIYASGSRYLPQEIMVQATGRDLCIKPYMTYLRNKFL